MAGDDGEHEEERRGEAGDDDPADEAFATQVGGGEGERGLGWVGGVVKNLDGGGNGREGESGLGVGCEVRFAAEAGAGGAVGLAVGGGIGVLNGEAEAGEFVLDGDVFDSGLGDFAGDVGPTATCLPFLPCSIAVAEEVERDGGDQDGVDGGENANFRGGERDGHGPPSLDQVLTRAAFPGPM